MPEIFVNLKRFDVPRSLGGVCPQENPAEWARSVIDDSVRLGIGQLPDTRVTFFFPEALLLSALNALKNAKPSERGSLSVGSQGVFREDIAKGGNFGAFTTNLPAAAAKHLGCDWALIGHSEERKDKFSIIAAYDAQAATDPERLQRANNAVHQLINEEVLCAFKSGLHVLLCVGETAEERGDGTFDDQKPRIEAVLNAQLEIGLKGVEEFLNQFRLAIGYEPRWAIGPGKTPPGAEYIGFVSTYIKSACQRLYGFTPPVVYGGGLKEENAAMVAGIPSIDGGLVALTRFTGEIGFDPAELKKIIDTYLKK